MRTRGAAANAAAAVTAGAAGGPRRRSSRTVLPRPCARRAPRHRRAGAPRARPPASRCFPCARRRHARRGLHRVAERIRQLARRCASASRSTTWRRVRRRRRRRPRAQQRPRARRHPRLHWWIRQRGSSGQAVAAARAAGHSRRAPRVSASGQRLALRSSTASSPWPRRRSAPSRAPSHATAARAVGARATSTVAAARKADHRLRGLGVAAMSRQMTTVASAPTAHAAMSATRTRTKIIRDRTRRPDGPRRRG